MVQIKYSVNQVSFDKKVEFLLSGHPEGVLKERFRRFLQKQPPDKTNAFFDSLFSCASSDFILRKQMEEKSVSELLKEMKLRCSNDETISALKKEIGKLAHAQFNAQLKPDNRYETSFFEMAFPGEKYSKGISINLKQELGCSFFQALIKKHKNEPLIGVEEAINNCDLKLALDHLATIIEECFHEALSNIPMDDYKDFLFGEVKAVQPSAPEILNDLVAKDIHPAKKRTRSLNPFRSTIFQVACFLLFVVGGYVLGNNMPLLLDNLNKKDQVVDQEKEDLKSTISLLEMKTNTLEQALTSVQDNLKEIKEVEEETPIRAPSLHEELKY